MKRRERCAAILLALALTAVLAACGEKPQAETKTAEETARAFLTEFYTGDSAGRYTEFIAAGDSEKAVDAYRASLGGYATQELVELLEANRTLAKYDAEYAGAAVDAVELGEPSDGVYSFTVEVTADGGTASFSGQITVEEADGGCLVSNFWPL